MRYVLVVAALIAANCAVPTIAQTTVDLKL